MTKVVTEDTDVFALVDAVVRLRDACRHSGIEPPVLRFDAAADGELFRDALITERVAMNSEVRLPDGTSEVLGMRVDWPSSPTAAAAR